MEEHRCLHEVDLALIASRQEENSKDTKQILKLLQGDNSKGLVTNVALHGASIRRVWWWLGAVSLGILGATFWIIRRGL